MKHVLYIIFFLFCVVEVAFSQLENTNSLRIDSENNTTLDKYSISRTLAKPGLSSTDNAMYDIPSYLKDYDEHKRQNESFDMTGDHDLLEYKPQNSTPKWFKKEDEGKIKGVKDVQYLGKYTNNSKYVTLIYRDFGSIDGDVVRIYVNKDVIASRAYLSESFKKIRINLIKGINVIDVEALTEGMSSPNTAEFHLIDENGVIVTSNQWALATGARATISIEKNK